MVSSSVYMPAKWTLDCLTVWSHASIHKGLCMDLSSANRPFGDSVFRNRLMGTCNCFLVAKATQRLRFTMVGLSVYMLAQWPLHCLTVWSHASIHKELCMDLSSANRPFGDSVFRNRLMGTCNCFLVAKSHTKTRLHHGEFKCVHASQVDS